MSRYQYIVMDVDGTLTDGKLYFTKDGELFKAFDAKDGYGLYAIAPQNGIESVVITGRVSGIVSTRCRELRIKHVYQNVQNKLETLYSITSDLSQVAYIGDDLNDIACMKAILASGGVVGAPCDAIKEVLEISTFISSHRGGDGAVREFLEWIIQQNQLN